MRTDVYRDNVASLIAMVSKQAIRDAMTDGDEEAVEWLDAMIPEWRKFHQPPVATAEERAGGVSSGSSVCWCGNSFTPKRRGQKFCRDFCRIMFHRKGMS